MTHTAYLMQHISTDPERGTVFHSRWVVYSENYNTITAVRPGAYACAASATGNSFAEAQSRLILDIAQRAKVLGGIWAVMLEDIDGPIEGRR